MIMLKKIKSSIPGEQSTYVIDKQLTTKVIEVAKKHLVSNILHTDQIPEKKLANVTNIYKVAGQSILALYDTTVFNSGKDGIIICKHLVGWKRMLEDAKTINFEELVLSSIDTKRYELTSGDRKLTLGSKEFASFFQSLKNHCVEDETLRKMYEEHITTSLLQLEEQIKGGHYQEATRELILMENRIVSSHSEYLASLYNHGCVLNMMIQQFDRAYQYYEMLHALQIWNDTKLNELKQELDKKKALYEFELLEEKKERTLAENLFEDAITIVESQKELHVVPKAELDREIDRINKMKDSYILTLERNISEALQDENYTSVLTTIEHLKKLTDKSYDEDYVKAKTGLYKFDEAYIRIQIIKNTKEELANNLLKIVEKSKETATLAIRNAVEKKDYTFYQEHEQLRSAKVSWGMTPLMHFIVNRDEKGVQLLADTHNPADRNLLGHNVYHLIAMVDDSFVGVAYSILDPTFIHLQNQRKKKERLNKVGGVLLKGVDTINNKALLNLEVAKASGEISENMKHSLDQIDMEIVEYATKKFENEYAEYFQSLLKPVYDNEKLAGYLQEKQILSRKVHQLEEKIATLSDSFDEHWNMFLTKTKLTTSRMTPVTKSLTNPKTPKTVFLKVSLVAV
ncbi:hypothetical protein ACERII_24110 [Evansella sp. AB-rgal1]|uniref:hypothetical protein n=1 Tax=Evansella sp. AB-rgal1 TaxID=3242696 RepID=UPI00359CF528